MNDNLYLQNEKEKYNNDKNKTIVFDEMQSGPMEEPVLIAYDIYIKKFKEYQNNIKKKRT